MKYSNEQLNLIHLNAVASVDRLKASEADLLVNLQKVRESRAYEFMGYKNIYLYAVHALRLSEGQAYAFTAVAKAAAKLPDLQSAIIEGDISVSMAKRVLPVINESNEEKWVHDLKTKTKREIEKEVARENPRAAVPDQAKYVTEDLMEMRFGISEENYQILLRSQDLCSQAMGRKFSMEETLVHLAREFNKRKDPVEKAQRAQDRTTQTGPRAAEPKAIVSRAAEPEKPKQAHDPGQPSKVLIEQAINQVENLAELLCPGIKSAPNPRLKPAVVYHAVNLRDKGQCQAKLPNGKICGDTQWVDVHHVIEVANGGPTTPQNLITLCKGHHRMWHRQQEERVNH
jgi:hypothetical protein